MKGTSAVLTADKESETLDGLAFPTRRRVYRRNRDGTLDRILAAITLDIDDITTA